MNTDSALLGSRAKPLLLLLLGLAVIAAAALWGPYSRNASQRHIAEGLRAAKLEDYARAAREFELAAWYDDNNADAFYNLGLAYVELGRDSDAVRAYSHALQIRPDEFAIHNNLGNAYNHLGETAKATQEWEISLRLNQRAVPPRVNLALAFERMGQITRALTYLREAAELDPNDAGVRYNLGAVYFRRGELEKAEAELRHASQLEPKLHGVVGKLAMIDELQGNFPQAVKEYRQAIREHSEDATLHYRLGRLLLGAQGNRKEAVRELEQYLELAPSGSEALEVRELLQCLKKKDCRPRQELIDGTALSSQR